jgi:hypothetical protein
MNSERALHPHDIIRLTLNILLVYRVNRAQAKQLRRPEGQPQFVQPLSISDGGLVRA